LNTSLKNVVILLLEEDSHRLPKEAEFCLDVAAHREGHIDEIWVINRGPKSMATNPSRFKRWGDTSKIRDFHLDPKIWPMDAGNNIYLRKPMSFYEALAGRPIPETIYTALRGAGAYFALQARKGGLIPDATKFITTCYLPHRLELQGNLTLPQHLKNVVDCELEEHCAKLSDEIWTSHEALNDAVLKAFRLPKNDSVFSLPPTPTPQSLKPIGRHIIFSGPALPLYGFDAFCDLAEKLEDDLDQVTVLLQATHHKEASRWAKSSKKRLSQLNITLDWQSVSDPIDKLETLESGILVALMRAEVLPAEVRAAQAAGLTTLWGTGFDTNLPDIQLPGLHAVISDARKAAETLRTVWGGAKSSLQKPILLPAQDKPVAAALAPIAPKPIILLSVIVTHHNRPEFLKQCLASLAAQTVSDFEVIIVDDGSEPDAISQVEDIVAQSSLKSISLSKIENSYPAAARNHGVQLARGEALFFVDDDNILDPKTIFALRNALEQNDLALSFFQTFQKTPPTFQSDKALDAGQDRAKLIGPAYGFAGLLPGCGLFHNLVGNASVMIRKETFKRLGGFSSKYGIGLEDYALMLKSAFEKDLSWVVLPEAYLHFRLHDDKIRNTHVDWASPVRLQAGNWRVIEDLSETNHLLSTASLAYARQLHEITQYAYIAETRPKYFRLRSIVLHQYIRPFLSRNLRLRRWVVKFTSGESRLAKWLEKRLF